MKIIITTVIYMKSYTYEQWADKGYQVKRGQISNHKNELGQKIFTPKQVIPLYRKKRN